MKKRSVITIILAGAMLASCSVPDTPVDTKQSEGTVTSAGTDETDDTTAQPQEASDLPLPDRADEGEEQYLMFMDKIRELEQSAPGTFRYSIGRYAYEDHVTYGFTLNVFGLDAPDDHMTYFLVDGEWTEDPEGVYYSSTYANYDYSRTYEDILRLPCIIDTYYLVHNEMEPVERHCCYTDEVDSVEDGRYFGKLIAVSGDGARAYIMIGEPVSFDYVEINALTVGDEIGYDDFIYSCAFGEREDGGFRQINLSSETHGDFLYLSVGSHIGYDSEMFLRERDGDYRIRNAVLVEVPIASDCEITDDYYNIVAEDYYDTELQTSDTGNPFLDSNYYAYCLLSDKLVTNNGWIVCNIGAIPLIIENGELASYRTGQNELS